VQIWLCVHKQTQHCPKHVRKSKWFLALVVCLLLVGAAASLGDFRAETQHARRLATFGWCKPFWSCSPLQSWLKQAV